VSDAPLVQNGVAMTQGRPWVRSRLCPPPDSGQALGLTSTAR
jgi:hypothetical protein